MSTVDPVAVRKLRGTKRPGPIKVVLGLAFQFIGGLAAGFGWPQLAYLDGPEPAVLAVAAIISSIPIIILSTMAWTAIVIKHSRLGLTLGGVAGWLGAATGVAVAAVELGSPPELAWAGAGCLAVSVALTALAIASAQKRRALAEREAKMMAFGTMTTATVSDKGYLVLSGSTKIFTTVTFTFRDGSGIQRWVQRPMLFSSSEPVVEGQEASLWYDPLDPGNEKKIVVNLAKDSPLRPA